MLLRSLRQTPHFLGCQLKFDGVFIVLKIVGTLTSQKMALPSSTLLQEIQSGKLACCDASFQRRLDTIIVWPTPAKDEVAWQLLRNIVNEGSQGFRVSRRRLPILGSRTTTLTLIAASLRCREAGCIHATSLRGDVIKLKHAAWLPTLGRDPVQPPEIRDVVNEVR
jgi:hypothetical protein